VQLAKSQVFPSSPPPLDDGPRHGGEAHILDLSSLPDAPVEITVPGVYVVNRDWRVHAYTGSIITITASNVVLDLQGFELFGETPTDASLIRSTGQDVTIRNGRVINTLGGHAIDVSGALTRIEGVEASFRGYPGRTIRLAGAGSVLTRSIVRAGENIALYAEDRTIVRDNDFMCVSDASCIAVEGNNTIFRGNELHIQSGTAPPSFMIRGDFNHVLDNVYSHRECAPYGIGYINDAMRISGRGNTIRNNLITSRCGVPEWTNGIVFFDDGNFYGDNIVWAVVPFNVGATVQTDLGGNVGFTN
jgi:hypothetical protein